MGESSMNGRIEMSVCVCQLHNARSAVSALAGLSQNL